MTDKKSKDLENKESLFNISDLKYILDVNQKAVEIYVEVEKQNDQIIKTLEQFKDAFSRVEGNISNLNASEKTIEEFLRDDNGQDHVNTMEMIKTLSKEIQDLTEEVRELKQIGNKNIDLVNGFKKDYDKDMGSKISEIDKNLFRLVVILGSAGIGTIFTVLQTFLHK